MSISEQGAQLERDAQTARQIAGETLATIIVNLDRGNLKCSPEAEKMWREFVDCRTKALENLKI